MPQGAALAGEPFVNAHYARQLEGWMMQRAATGQLYSAPERTLSFRPVPSLAVRGTRLPWFAGSAAAGVLIVGGSSTATADQEDTTAHTLLVSLGALPAGLTVTVTMSGVGSDEGGGEHALVSSTATSRVVLAREVAVGEEVTIVPAKEL